MAQGIINPKYLDEQALQARLRRHMRMRNLVNIWSWKISSLKKLQMIYLRTSPLLMI